LRPLWGKNPAVAVRLGLQLLLKPPPHPLAAFGLHFQLHRSQGQHRVRGGTHGAPFGGRVDYTRRRYGSRPHYGACVKLRPTTGRRVDTTGAKITVARVALLQTRVDERTARNFARAAKARGHTPDSYLQELVKNVAAKPSRRTWKQHFEWRDSLGLKLVPYGIVARQREESDER